MYGIIYKTTNTINGKIYVGQHKTQIIDDGYVGSGKLIRRSIEKYGAENFIREVLEVVYSREEAGVREEFWIGELDATKPAIGYNITQYAWGGQPHTDESRAKISTAHTGRVLSEETKQKISNSHKGKTVSQETKDKLRKLSLGEKNHMFGKKMSIESREKMRKAWVLRKERK